ncbi:hypothetical protein K443DRAFT_151610 [Laccaria amethystina LaAM-08-1]|uniref:Unplaced genomic scaffold K443scaffold_10, whole genome shotgun sequence n=1 Tax=Laccaria amethystina LaAM-08-1 TaxID=1095629 RepID=A0A0C9YIC2_9AGAR|nr:hypothetical protein K443DRAFT_151610 [Laccaria amethystina LaAM-08-1]
MSILREKIEDFKLIVSCRNNTNRSLQTSNTTFLSSLLPGLRGAAWVLPGRVVEFNHCSLQIILCRCCYLDIYF